MELKGGFLMLFTEMLKLPPFDLFPTGTLETVRICCPKIKVREHG